MSLDLLTLTYRVYAVAERYIITDEGVEFCAQIVLDHYRDDPGAARALAEFVGLDFDAFLAKHAPPRETLHTEGPYR